MNYAPIIVFAFNRPDLLKSCVASLLANEEAAASDLYVFVDGPRPEKPSDKRQVNAVRNYISTITGFKSLHYQFAEQNQGLAPSVINGVTSVINYFGRAIVVEDDLFVSDNFLAFMNAGLEKYRNNTDVFSICGYSNRVKAPKDYAYDSYFCVRSSSWGWATWKDRWDSVDWDLSDWQYHRRNARRFNRWGGSDCWRMLSYWHKGRVSSWAIRFGYSQFLQNKVSLYPLVSKVRNDGFDGSGTNGQRWTRFKSDFDNSGNKSFRLPASIEINRSLYKQVLSYNSISKRVFSRIMYHIV